MSVISLEKHPVQVNGETVFVRLKRLGNHEIELITSDLKEKLRQKLFKAINAVAYTVDTEVTDKRNITCRLITTLKKNFNRLISKIVRLFGKHVESHEEEPTEEPTLEQTEPSTTKKRSRRYYKRHKPRYTNGPPNHKVAATRS